MVFKNFRLVCVTRVLFLMATMTLAFVLWTYTALYATTTIVIIALILQVWALIRYIDRSNRDLGRFLLAIQHADFSQSYRGGELGGSHDELRELFNDVLRKFRQARTEKEEQYRYLQTVVRHIGVGLIAFHSDGSVDLINAAAKRLLAISRLRSIQDLNLVSEKLVEALQGIQSGEKKLLKIDIGGEASQIAVYATEFRQRSRTIKLVSLQNITSELIEREMEAWQKLVRVLTHEITNSVTPIASLAGTVRGIVSAPESQDDGEAPGLVGPPLQDVRAAVTTIEKRSQGLVHFVESYRNLTRIPKPDFQIVSVRDMLDSSARLIQSRPDAADITLTVDVQPQTLELSVDPDLIEQVLLNLLQNAVQALSGRPKGTVELSARLSGRGNTVIEVADNGPGVQPEALDQLFVPFFTTKKDGTGIGLSLSRQIMRLHRGSVAVSSEPGVRTSFTLRF